MRVAIAMVWHEDNSFSPVPTGLDSFRAGGWAVGEEVRALHGGTAGEMGGAPALLGAHLGHRCARAGRPGRRVLPVPHAPPTLHPLTIAL